MSSFCFVLTEKCNWKCKYCEFPKIENPKHTNIDILSKHLPYIKEIINKINGTISFSDIAGGEVGLLPIDTIRYFLRELDYPMVVSTNGKFLEKRYHLDPIIRPYITEIFYHVHPEPKGFKIDYDYNDDDIFINKGIVHDDIDEMVEFIKINSHIQFSYIEFEYNVDEERQFDGKLYKELHEKIQNFSNVIQNAKDHLVKRFVLEPPRNREACTKFNTTAVLDMVNEKILLCHRSQMNSIPLTKDNLIKRLTKYPKDIFLPPNRCNSCTRLYFGKMSSMRVEDFFKTRRMLCQ